jgi:prepilin-type N-terminal cleavage/methylation domain-containing protein
VAARCARDERGFTLIEVLVATAIFIFIALAGFETVRQLGALCVQLAQRAAAASSLNTALAQMRSDASSSAAVWVPNAPCGAPAISMMQRSAAGTSFASYVLRAPSLVRVAGAGPVDPCDTTLTAQTILTNVTGVTVTAVPAPSLATQADGAFFRASGITAVAVDSHERDYDGSTILTGNGIVDVAVDADPALAHVDLIAGSRPSGYTVALTYACGPRCQANGTASTAIFPELRSLDETTCTIDGADLPNTSAFYVPSATGVGAGGRIVVTQYRVQLRYGYTFAGGASPALTVYRLGPAFVWPATASLADPYPVDYTANTVIANVAAIIAGAPASGLATDDAICTGMDAETDFHG